MVAILLVIATVFQMSAAQPILDPSQLDIVNANSSTGWMFRPYGNIEEYRQRWNWFMEGANATHYAPNATHCFNRALDLYQYDLDLLMIKWMFGNFRENMLNGTVFMGNVSDVTHICVDASENLFVWSQYKFESFGSKFNNVLLAGIQNVLGRVLDIQRVYNQILLWNIDGETELVWRQYGRIYQMMIDFDAVEFDQAGMDDDIFLQGPIEFDGPEPIQQQLTWEEYRVNRMPVVGDDVDDFVISGIDLTFGLGDTFPGLRKLMTISGPIEFWRGFVFGSAVSNHTSLDQCYDNTDSLLIANLEMVNNRTGNIFRAPDFGEMVFSTFDLFKVFADIFGGLYPVTFSCWGAGEWIVGHYWSTLKLNTTIKPYLMNIVYNFGDVFDALGGFWFFMKAETRGQEDEVFDAGDSLGQAFFYLINPEMPDYASQADLEGLRE